MPSRQEELKDLTTRFVDAFNRQDIDGIIGFFTDDAVYEDSCGGRHVGPDAIRAAFEPLVCGGCGNIQFDDEDYFAEVDSDKVMASWTLTMEIDGTPMKLRGLDVLHFTGDKISAKLAYCKAATPQMDAA